MPIEIEGLGELVSRLNSAADTLSREIADALNAAADAFVDEAQANAPVDTGYLRDHIVTTNTSDREAIIESQATYSAAQEFGTYKMSAQPYFFQSAPSAELEMQRRLAEIQL